MMMKPRSVLDCVLVRVSVRSHFCISGLNRFSCALSTHTGCAACIVPGRCQIPSLTAQTSAEGDFNSQAEIERSYQWLDAV